MEWIKFSEKTPPKNSFIYVARDMNKPARVVFVYDDGSYQDEYCGSCNLYIVDDKEKIYEYWCQLPKDYWDFCTIHKQYYFRHFCSSYGDHGRCETIMNRESAIEESKQWERFKAIAILVSIILSFIGLYGLVRLGLWYKRKSYEIVKDVIIDGTVESAEKYQQQKNKGIKPLFEYFSKDK